MADRGPPSSFKPEYCDLARKFCTLGATNEDLGRMFDVTRRMIDYWMVDFPDFAAAIALGRAICQGGVTRKPGCRHLLDASLRRSMIERRRRS